jgi:parallel beta-helix repeat protein
MKHSRLSAFALSTAFLASCGGDGNSNFPEFKCSQVTSTTNCVEIEGGDTAALLAAANSLEDDTTLVLGEGTFAIESALTIRNASIHIVGQGMDATILDYGASTTQFNGIDVIGDDFLVQGLTVLDVPKDGIRVESSNGVVYRDIKATWSTPGDSTNGAYGIYPVKCQNVLVEDSAAEHASDAGLYVGQCQHVIVRNNLVTGNVAGLEIENTQFADVYGNTAEFNTAGIVVFDLPGNPIVGRDVHLYGNTIRNNNQVNFAPGGTVAMIPVGTGTFAMASRRVKITGNAYSGNNTADIAVISGLALESNPSAWALQTATLVGPYDDLGLIPGGPGVVLNFRSENVVVSGNTHDGSGAAPDPIDPLHLGMLLSYSYPDGPVDSVLYDTIQESSWNATDASMNTNDNHICVGGNLNGTFASLNFQGQDQAQMNGQPPLPFFRPAAPFTPFQCTTLNGEDLATVVLVPTPAVP